MEQYDVIVVGGGAAGLLAAGRAAEKGQRVLILEKMEREGRKLLITGKGRCNITNDAPVSEFIKHVYPQGRFLKNAFSQFFSKDIIELIENHGTDVALERGGRYFPASNQSKDVLQAILRWVKKYNVEILYHHKAEKLIVEDDKIKGIQSNGKTFTTSNIIIATGGKSYPATGSTGEGYELVKPLGHTITTPRPSLVPLETKGNTASRLQGLSLKNATAAVWVNEKKREEAFGELLFTHFGLSGPIILTLSRLAVDELRNGNKVDIYIDLKPALDDKKLDNRLLRELDENGKKKIGNIFKNLLPSKMIPIFIDITGIDPDKQCHQISSKERKRIRYYLKNFHFEVTGHRPFKEAIITAGGIPTTQISSKTMESKLVKGLYFAGEIIDLDAETGGYNLQIAWSTGWLAGDSTK
jgi:predicted Rossmann fold flavoprotein